MLPTIPASPASSSTRSRDSPSPDQSRIHLPPNITDSSDAYLEGATPNVLVDRALGLHSKRPGLERKGESLASVLGVVEGPQTRKQDRRSERSRSQSLRRKLKWYERPSPIWFLPGTLVMSLSIGMIISPKIEIYTQLVCRAVGPERSGTTLPEPMGAFEYDGMRVKTVHAVGTSGHGTGWYDAMWVQHHYEHAGPHHAAGEDYSIVQEQDTWSKQCRRSPQVQKAVTALATSLSLLMGLLSALTTGYWGALSDRRGRKPILALALFGTVFMDFIFLVVVKYHATVGYQFLLIGPAFDGLLGGMTTAQAATNAYLTDCTESGSRARLFSILGGILFGGIALGPIAGAVAINLTGSILTPFYLALSLHCAYLLVVAFVIPESLSMARQLDARKRQAEEQALEVEEAIKEDLLAQAQGTSMAVLVTRVKRVAWRMGWFLRPLGLLLPRKRSDDEKEEDRPTLERGGERRVGWDFELLKVAIGYGSYVMVMSIMSVKILYASFKYDWGPQENGYYLTLVGASRVLVLIVIIPFAIKLFRKPTPVPSSPQPEEPLMELEEGSDERNAYEKSLKEWEEEAKYLRVVHDSHFDLLLAQASIFVDIVGYAYTAFGLGPIHFILSTLIQSFGGGATAAMQSLALAFASPRDVGRLFASLSVLSSISSQVVGPLAFGILYIKTVGFFPELIYWAAVVLFSVSFTAMMMVRLGAKLTDGEIQLPGDDEEGPSGGRGAREAHRGRSSTRKVGTNAGDSGIVIR